MTKDAAVFVIVPGIGMSHRYSEPLRSELERTASVVSLDLPGFAGFPGSPATAHMTVADRADAIAAHLDGRGITRAVVIGHSMGAQFAVELARTQPSLVSRLVLMAPVVDPAQAHSPAADARPPPRSGHRDAPRGRHRHRRLRAHGPAPVLQWPRRHARVPRRWRGGAGPLPGTRDARRERSHRPATLVRGSRPRGCRWTPGGDPRRGSRAAAHRVAPGHTGDSRVHRRGGSPGPGLTVNSGVPRYRRAGGASRRCARATGRRATAQG